MKHLSYWYLRPPPWFPHGCGARDMHAGKEKSAKALSTLTICPQLFPSASGKERPFSYWWLCLGKLKYECFGLQCWWFPWSPSECLAKCRRVTSGGRLNLPAACSVQRLLAGLPRRCCPSQSSFPNTTAFQEWCHHFIFIINKLSSLCKTQKNFKGTWDSMLPRTPTFCPSSQRCSPQCKHLHVYFSLSCLSVHSLCVYMRMCVEVWGQFAGVGSTWFSPPTVCDPGIRTQQAIGLGSKHLYWLSHLTSPIVFFPWDSSWDLLWNQGILPGSAF